MEPTPLIQQLAEQQGRGHGELRHMAKMGILKDQHGNPVSFEDLMGYSPDSQPPQVWLTRIDRAWQGYQAAKDRLAKLSEDSLEDQAEMTQLIDRVEQSRMRVANIPEYNDSNWESQVLDQAHELCGDLQDWTEDLLRKISHLDSQEGSEA